MSSYLFLVRNIIYIIFHVAARGSILSSIGMECLFAGFYILIWKEIINMKKKNSIRHCEFDKILDMLAEYAYVRQGLGTKNTGSWAISLRKLGGNSLVHLNETTKARLIYRKLWLSPCISSDELEKSLSLLDKGGMLMPEQLERIAHFSCHPQKAETLSYKSSILVFNGSAVWILHQWAAGSWRWDKSIDQGKPGRWQGFITACRYKKENCEWWRADQVKT